MPSSTRSATPGPSNVSQSSKRNMSDVESAPQGPKKARRNSLAEPSTRRDSGRDTKRRRKKKKKAPVVSAGAVKGGATKSRLEERSRAPLSMRNEVIRRTSAPPEADLPASSASFAKPSSQALLSNPLVKRRESLSYTPDGTTEQQNRTMSSTPCNKKRAASVDVPVPERSACSLGSRVAQLEAELKSRDNLIASHQALLNQVQQAVTCQVCLDLMYKPYALAPCGHLACYSCLVSWFTAPPTDNRPTPPAIMRRKTCPHCRAIVRERPVEVWGVKGIAQAMGKSGLVPNQLPISVEAPEGLDADSDPWKEIFPKPGVPSHRAFPWLLPGDDTGGDDVGMLDMEDGGIFRCLDCMHEIWGGVCSSCGRVYPGHRREGDDEGEEGDPMGWLEDQMGAEEVDMADDPGWMGLEDGEADDSGDVDDWRPFAPWRRQFRMFGEPWRFLRSNHVDEENEDEGDVDSRVDDLRVRTEDEESGDEGYESSFIDDDEEGGIADSVDGPRIYGVGDDEDDRGRPGRISTAASSDEEADECEDDTVPSRRRWHSRLQRRGLGVVDSEESEGSY